MQQKEVAALVIDQVGRVITTLWRHRINTRTTISMNEASAPAAFSQSKEEGESKATGVEAGCVPCAIGHFGTCTGLLNEAMRFAKKDGLSSVEVIDRVNMCLDELNTMERVDLRSELIAELPDWEKNLADRALQASRSTRHGLESISSSGSVEELERLTASTQTVRQEIGRGWFKEKLNRLSPQQREAVKQKIRQELGSENDIESG